MEISTVLSLGVVGAATSVLIQFLKNKYGLESIKAKVFTLVVALVVAGLFYTLTTIGYIETFVSILASASTVYAFFIKGSK